MNFLLKLLEKRLSQKCLSMEKILVLSIIVSFAEKFESTIDFTPPPPDFYNHSASLVPIDQKI